MSFEADLLEDVSTGGSEWTWRGDKFSAYGDLVAGGCECQGRKAAR
jgi:hypothetical protein